MRSKRTCFIILVVVFLTAGTIRSFNVQAASTYKAINLSKDTTVGKTTFHLDYHWNGSSTLYAVKNGKRFMHNT